MTKLINKLNLLAVAVSAMMSNYVFATTQVIHAGELLSIPGKKTLNQQTVFVQDGKILLVKKVIYLRRTLVKMQHLLIYQIVL